MKKANVERYEINNYTEFIIKVLVSCIMITIIMWTVSMMTGGAGALTVYAADKKKDTLHIELDAGHGGVQSGAEAADGLTLEKDINLKLAQALKRHLEEYENVKVFMVRDDDEKVSLEERTSIALEDNADIMISLHNNATGSMVPYDHGSTVLAANGNYREDIAKEEYKLGVNLLYELSALGLENQGIMIRDSEVNETYENGKIADYYALIRAGILQNIPTIIIEHAFVDDEHDFDCYLSADDKIEKLAEADAKGIARYYQLKRKENGEISKALTDVNEKIVHVINENWEDNVNNIEHFDTTISINALNKDSLDIENDLNSMSTSDKIFTDMKSKEVENNTLAESTNEKSSLKKSFNEEDKAKNTREIFQILFILIVAAIAIVITLWNSFRKGRKYNKNDN